MEMTRMNKPPIPCHEGYRGIKTKETTRDKTRQDKTRQDKIRQEDWKLLQTMRTYYWIREGCNKSNNKIK